MLTHEQYGMCCAERKKCTIKENKAEYVYKTDYIRAEQSEKNRNRSGADENLIFIQSRNTIEAAERAKRFDRQSLERVVVHIFHHLVHIATIYRATNLNSDRALAIRIYIYEYIIS